MRRAALLLGYLVGACGGDTGTVVYITVEARPTVQASSVLSVEISNEGGSITQEFDIAGASFPRTFTVTPTGRTGTLTVSVTAYDETGVSRASTSGAVEIVPDERVDLTLQLDPDDFLVNQQVVRTQWLAFREELAGRQLGVRPDGTFLVSWENDCPLSRCDIVARLFGPTTRALTNGTTMNDGDFIVNQVSEYTESPSIAVGDDGFFVAWMFQIDGMIQYDIKATMLDAGGAHVATIDQVVSGDVLNDREPAAFPRDGGFVVAWTRDRPAPATGTEIRARLFSADGLPLNSDFAVSSAAGGDQATPHGAALPGGGFVIVFVHRDEGGTATNVLARVFDGNGQAITALDQPVTTYTASEVAFGPHVAATPDGYAVGWQIWDFADPALALQPLRARRYAPGGAALSTEITLDDETGSFYSKPILASLPNGAIGAVWTDCMAGGDVGASCGIRFRMLHPSGMPNGPAIVANTTTTGDQLAPSLATLDGVSFLAAWTDGSLAPPDTDGSGVRGRVLYPRLERRDGTIGALCGAGGDAECQGGLVCSASAAGIQLCHETCAGTCPNGGVCTEGACKF